MPTANAPAQPKKKNNKELLLELIQKQYGLPSATVMEKALKTQDKQIEEAMGQGMSAEEIAQTKGIDLKGMGNTFSPQNSPQSSQPEQPKSKGKKGNFWYTPFQMDKESGEVTPASILGGLISQHPQNVLQMAQAQTQGQMGGMKELQTLLAQQRLGLSQERLGLEKQMESRRIGQEVRRTRQQTVDNMKYFGASVTPEMLEANPTLNSVVTPLVKKFGITPQIDEQSGQITFEIPMQEELKQKALLETGIQKKELESMAEKLPNLDRATEALNSLKSTFNTAWTPNSIEEGSYVEGVMERIRGTAAIPIESWTQVNPELHTYLSNVGAFSSLLSKGGFMEAGVLTNQDIQRVIQALPRPGYSKERVALAWKTVDDIFSSARKNFESKKKEYTGKTGTQPQGQPKKGFKVIGVR